MAKKTTKDEGAAPHEAVRAACGEGGGQGAARKSRGAADQPERTSAGEAVRGKYVYCVIQSADPLKFGAAGIGDNGTEIHTVHYRDLAAVVSDVPLGVLDSTRENVLAHERVNEIVMRDHTVIPMSFGTIFKTQGRHRAAPALGLRRVRRRAVEDARQDGVRPQGAVGSRLDRQGHRGRRRRAFTG